MGVSACHVTMCTRVQPPSYMTLWSEVARKIKGRDSFGIVGMSACVVMLSIYDAIRFLSPGYIIVKYNWPPHLYWLSAHHCRDGPVEMW